MSRDSYRQGWDDAQHFGEPNRKLYIDPYSAYREGFDGYMKEHPLEVDEEQIAKENFIHKGGGNNPETEEDISLKELKEEKREADVRNDILAEEK